MPSPQPSTATRNRLVLTCACLAALLLGGGGMLWLGGVSGRQTAGSAERKRPETTQGEARAPYSGSSRRVNAEIPSAQASPTAEPKGHVANTRQLPSDHPRYAAQSPATAGQPQVNSASQVLPATSVTTQRSSLEAAPSLASSSPAESSAGTTQEATSRPVATYIPGVSGGGAVRTSGGSAGTPNGSGARAETPLIPDSLRNGGQPTESDLSAVDEHLESIIEISGGLPDENPSRQTNARPVGTHRPYTEEERLRDLLVARIGHAAYIAYSKAVVMAEMMNKQTGLISGAQ